MTKYKHFFKQQVIEFYLQNSKNRSLTRKYFQVVRGIFQHCINQFNYSEINELDLSG